MKSLVASLLLASAIAHGQEIIETTNGTYRAFQDEHGRYLRLESSDGVVVNYLYDSPAATAESGVAIKVANGPTLIVHYEASGFWTPGMPKVNVIGNAEERTAEIRADEKTIAAFEYRADKYVGEISIPGRFTMRFTPPDARHRMRQTLVNGNGGVIHETEVVSSAAEAGIWNRVSFDGVEQALGFDPRTLLYRESPAGYLNTGRDANGRAALYIVTVGRNAVGFTRDGVPRFYDVTAEIFDSEVPAGSDCGHSIALEQNKAVPAHVTLTGGGMPGVYVDTPANGAIYAVWVESDGRGGTVTKYARATAVDKPTPATR
jgi:hypothetical protein